MALPETIVVRYTEDEAGYVSIRPVVKQTFQAAELVDMVVKVAGKESERVAKILMSGTVVYNAYRYWWTGFEAEAAGLNGLLAKYPDAEPGREFRAELCVVVVLESGGTPARYTMELEKGVAEKGRLLRKGSFWESVMGLTRGQPPRYQGYSYVRKADMYAVAVSTEQAARLVGEAKRVARRGLRAQLGMLGVVRRAIFYCGREAEQG